MRIVAPLALATVLALSLTGCFANPVEGIVEQVIEDQTGVDVDVNSDGSGASLPAGWPAEVPVPDGTILASFAAGDVYSATIQLADEAAGEAGLDALINAGFAVETEADFGGLKSYVLFADSLAVTYAWGDDGEGTFTLNMSVAPRES
jgi:hypothetical protein